MTITNKLNLPAGLVKAVTTERHNAPGCISATTLLKGVKEIILTERHWEDLTDDVADRVWAVFGTAVHELLEHEGETDFTEEEIRYKVGDVTVTGRLDNYDMATGTICDYKTASATKVKLHDFDDWERQGLMYAWLMTKNNFPVKRCRFIAMLKDHSKTEAARDHQYPQSPVYVYEFDVTPTKLFTIGLFIRSRVNRYIGYKDTPDDEIPACAPQERWERPTKYAVKKEGRKTAVKLFDDQAEADAKAAELGTGHYVEHRAGESVKCQSYCLCSGFCNFHNETSASEPDTTEEKLAA
jgi:hypothetical protein